ncbi:uncharacterized protein LOC132757348 [Ruditapes philippinarum]|uniref:uncharacterized protein LOC132757348 n=1 Tax=Ruditapes philippinarum TaxID=129788 RepID=UPI00295B2B44|nr:uncharacterized protein LOC132757348 [Ruditapes philippinarum]
MADVNDRLESGDVAIATSFPSHNEIVIHNQDITIETSDQDSSCNKELREKRRRKRPRSFKDEHSQYAQIGIHVEKPSSPISEKSSSTKSKAPKSPTSVYTVGGSDEKPRLELKAREVSTRQCTFEIGEEWEQFQTIRPNKSISCPPSPVSSRKDDKILSGRDNPGYAASEPGAEIDQDLTDSSDKTKDPFPFHFLFNSSSSNPLKQHHIVPNPFNKINHRFHSTLQCPCFLFFFFLCCLPAVHLMQKSDRSFKNGNNRSAKNFGKFSTFFYLLGSIIGVAFLSISIYFAADYVRQFVSESPN